MKWYNGYKDGEQINYRQGLRMGENRCSYKSCNVRSQDSTFECLDHVGGYARLQIIKLYSAI